MHSTASLVAEQLMPNSNTNLVVPSEDDEQTADYAAEWVLKQDDCSDYISNLHKAINAGAISPKRIGLVASAVYAHQRYQERLQADNKPVCNEHLGQIKDRLKGLTATVERVRHTEGYYGSTSIITLRTPAGHIVVWFATGYHDPAIGEVWNLDGTVKKHDEFNGTCQTVLTRVKYST
jgi:hypothetical protein